MSNNNELDAIRKKKAEALMTESKKEVISLPDSIVHINSVEDFNSLVEKYQETPIIIDFWAPWCGPCKMFGPVFEAAQKSEWGSKFIFAKLNTETPAGAVSQGLGITGIPASVFILGKKEIHRQVGAMRKKGFYDILEKLYEAIQKM